MSDERNTDPEIDLALVRGLTERRLSRGNMLRMLGAGAGSLSLASFLAACGTAGSSGKTGKTNVGSAAWWDAQKAKSSVTFANWPLYIDVAQQGGHNVHPSLKQFTHDTGIKVDYKEVIQDYPSFFGKIRPNLAAGQYTGYDLIVIGYPRWLPLMIRLGYLIRLDKRHLPNFQKYGAQSIKNPSYDPGNTYSIPWQSGITGIGYNPQLTGRDITSLQDLQDPKFKGKVGMFSDTQDLPNLALLAIGVDPVKSTKKDWQRALAWLEKQKRNGIVRQYYDQSYIDALSKGDIWLGMAYSGDIFQANLSGAKGLKFVVPKEGGLLWNDDMCIPMQSHSPVAALKLMDFFFKPKVAAEVAEYIHYITPVPAAQPIIERDAARATGKQKALLESAARSPLVFPTTAETSRLYRYRDLTPSEQTSWDNMFQPIYQS